MGVPNPEFFQQDQTVFFSCLENFWSPFHPAGIITSKHREKKTVLFSDILKTPETTGGNGDHITLGKDGSALAVQTPVDFESALMNHEHFGGEVTVEGVLDPRWLSCRPDVKTVRLQDVDHLFSIFCHTRTDDAEIILQMAAGGVGVDESTPAGDHFTAFHQTFSHGFTLLGRLFFVS